MRLLITTQAVDLDDPVLSFFHKWIEEFAKNAEIVHVICLNEGRHQLPGNVVVHSLGKEGGVSKTKYISRFYTYVWQLRHDYDVVFVHMNPEYLVLAGFLWRLWGKIVALWYIHPRATSYLKFGIRFPHVIFSASKESFPLPSQKLVPVGLGVDTDFFSPGDSVPGAAEVRVMCVARIAPVKHVEVMIDAVSALEKMHCPITFDYYGEALPRDASYAEMMRKKADPISAWIFHGKADAEKIRNAYRAHDVHVNATDTGSFDKAVFESMASGCITVACNKALRDILPKELLFEEDDATSLAHVLDRVAHMSVEDRRGLSKRMRAIAEERYSLPALIGRILDVLV